MTAQIYATQQVRGIQFRDDALEANANSIIGHLPETMGKA